MSGNTTAPGSLNRYSYAGADPIVNVDPSGRRCEGYLVAGTAAFGIGFRGSAETSGVGVGYCRNETSGRVTVGAFKYGGRFSQPNEREYTIGLYAGVGVGSWWSNNARSFSDLAGPFLTQSWDLPFFSVSRSVGDTGIEVIAVTIGPAVLAAYTQIVTNTEILFEREVAKGY